MRADLDARIQAELEPGEVLLWRTTPRLLGLLTPFSILLMAAGLIAIPIGYGYLASVALKDDDPDLLIAARAVALVLVAMIVGHTAHTIWSTPRRLYALTNRRLLEWNGSKLRRAETALDVERIRVVHRLAAGAGDVVWRIETQARSSDDSAGTKNRHVPIGFKGIGEPDQVGQMLQRWYTERVEESRRANRAFRLAAVEGRIADLVARGEATAITRSDLGFAVAYPATWYAFASKSIQIGPIPGKWQAKPLAKAGSDWDNLMLRSFDGTSLEIGFVSDGNRKTLQELRRSPWAAILNVQELAVEADIQLGPWRGFAITSTLEGAGLFGLPLLRSGHLYREIWLEDGRRQIILKMTCPKQDQEAQLAVDATIGTLEKRPIG